MARNGEYMALYNLNRIQNNASNMQQLMQVNNTLPEWAKSKLTQSRSHLSDVANYKRSKPLGSFYRIYDEMGTTLEQAKATRTGVVVGLGLTVLLYFGARKFSKF